MWLATKYGWFSIVQKQAPDDGEAAVYHVRARVKQDLEHLVKTTALQNEIQECHVDRSNQLHTELW